MNKRTRRLIFLLSIVAVLILFVGCKKDEEEQVPYNAENPGEIFYSEVEEEYIEMSDSGTQYVNNEVLIVAKDGVSKKEIEKLAENYHAEVVGYIEVTGDYQWRFNESYTYDELMSIIEQLNKEEIVESANIQSIIEGNIEAAVTPNDTRWASEWDSLNPKGENWGIEAIYAPYAWQFTENMTPVKVGLIDNMFNEQHNDLFFAETFYNKSQDKISDDHGTHVAGTIAAAYNNQNGITGVYPFGGSSKETSNLYGVSTNYNGNIFFYKVAFAELIVRDVKVINVSLGYEDVAMFLAVKGNTEVQDDIKAHAKILGDFLEKILDKGYDFVITNSAGNARDNRFKQTGDSTEYPYGWEEVAIGGETNVDGMANWGSPISVIDNERVRERIIVVGAVELINSIFLDYDYKLADFSDTGSRVDVLAPGVDITSCSYGTDSYSEKQGTSMAAPHVAGAAAMLWSFNPSLSGDRVKEIIVNSASTDVEDTDVGMINVLEALADSADEGLGANPFEAQHNGVILAVVHNGESIISEAKVMAKDAESGKEVLQASTDSAGEFELVVPAGTYNLTVSADGYVEKTIENVSIKNGEVLRLGSIVLEDAVKDFTIPTEMVVTVGELDVVEPEIFPADATGYTIKWTSSDETVATISPTGESGIINALNKGTTVITAELVSGGKTITKTMNLRVASKARDTILVLDVSGSMYGDPMEEMKESAIQFCNDLLLDEYNNRVGLVFYDDEITKVDLTNDLAYLKDCIANITDGGTTDMEAGLSTANNMMVQQGKDDAIKNIIIMADGLPNEGKSSNSNAMPAGAYSSYYESVAHANAVIDTAKSMMGECNLYSLGFFHDLADLELEFSTTLMKQLTNMDNGYYLVEEAENLQFAFGDISENITNGSKIVINIACPVDVSITYNGETLSSSGTSYNDKTSFGTLQLLGKDKDIKVVSLDNDKQYDVTLTGTGEGTMNYSVNYIDANESMTDYRNFENVPITQTTVIASNTNNVNQDVSLNIDNDSDGEVDSVWTAGYKEDAVVTYENEPTPAPTDAPTEAPTSTPVVTASPEPEKDTMPSTTVIAVGLGLSVVILVAVGIVAVAAFGNSKSKNDEYEIPIINKADSAVDQKDKQIEVKKIEREISIVNGSMRGFSAPINSDEIIYIGKDPTVSNIVISKDYYKVSRLHCSVIFDSKFNKYFVTDTSRNGTSLADGTKLEMGKRTAVHPGSRIMLADDECIILLK